MQKQRWIVALILVFSMVLHALSPVFSASTPIASSSLISFLSHITEDKVETLTFTMDPRGFTIFQQHNNSSIQLQEYETISIPGKPRVWFQQKKISIDKNYQFLSLELISIDSESIELKEGTWKCSNEPYIMSVDQKNHNFKGDIESSFSTSSFFMDQNSSFPPQPYQIFDPDLTVSYIQIHLYPIVYHSPVKAEYIKEFTFQIQYSPKNIEKPASHLQSSSTVIAGLIVAPDYFQSAALELQKYQRDNGVQSDVVLISEILHRPEFPPSIQEPLQGYEEIQPSYLQQYNSTLAYQIRDCIYDRYNNQEFKLQYVTLLGDADHVPPSYYVFCEESESDYEKWIPTDLYYSHFAVDTFPVKPLISLGRIPCNNEEEALIMVQNIINGHPSKLSQTVSPIVLSGGDPFSQDRYFAETVQAHHINQHRIPSQEIEKQFATTEDCTATKLSQRLQDHSFSLVWAFGHGDGSRLLFDQGEITSKDISRWNAGHNHGLMISEGCGNASFDQHLLGHKKEPSFGASLLSSKSGFTSYFGSTRDCWCGWDLRIENGVPTVHKVFYGEAIIQYFLEELQHSETLGRATMKAFQTYSITDYLEPNEPFLKTLFGFSFLGDPTTSNPFFQKVPLSQDTSIDKKNQVCSSVDSIPAFSVHKEMEIDLSSHSPYIRLILFNKDKNKVVVDQIFSPTLRREQGSHYFHITLPMPYKGDFIARFESENGQEKRLYLQGKKEHDLVLIPSFDLLLLSKGVSKEYSFQIRNDGFSEEENIRASVTEKTQTILRKELETIPPYGTCNTFFSIQPKEEGEKQIDLSIVSAFQSLSKLQTLHVTSQPITRIGILCPNSANERNEVQQQLMIEDVNKDLSRRLLNIELQAVPFAPDRNGLTTFDRLHFDILMLFSQPEDLQNHSELLYRLVEFEKKGGIVCGMIPFGYSQSNARFNLLLQNYFGIHENEKLAVVETSYHEDKLYIQDKRWLQNFRSEYRLKTQYALASLKSSWPETQLLSDAVLMGFSKNNDNAFIEYRNRILFTGYLNTDCFNSLDDSYTFFLDFIQFARNQYIQKQSHYISAIEIVPDQTGNIRNNNEVQSRWMNTIVAKEPVFPTATQIYNDTVWIATVHGFYKTTVQKPSEFTFFMYPEELIRKIGPILFKEMVSKPSRNRFRVYQDKIVFYGEESFFVFRPEQQYPNIQEIHCTLFDTFVMPIEQFSSVVDFEIHEHGLYVLDRNNQITVIDIPSGRILSRFQHFQKVGIDLHIYNDHLYVLHPEGSIESYTLQGFQTTTIPLMSSIHPYSFFISNQGTIFLYCNHEESGFYEIPLHLTGGGTQNRNQKSFMIRNDQLGDVEQFFIRHDTLIGIFSSSSERDDLSFKGLWLAYDLGKNTQIFCTSMEKEYYTNVNHTLFSADCWVANDGTFLVRQQEPLKDIIDLYSPDTMYWQSSIALSDYAPNYSLLDFTYHSSHERIYALYSSHEDLLLVTLDPIHPDRWQKMEISSGDSKTIQSISVFQELLLMIHRDGMIEVYNTSEKRTLSVFYPVSNTKERYALQSSQILVDQKTIYLVDRKGNQLFGFAYTGDLLFCHSLQSSVPNTYTKAALLNTGEIALLNQNANSIQLFHQGKFTRNYNVENNFPLSFHATKSQFLVIDYYVGIQLYSR
ncbi:MAG: C25 family cysteine peptidase [Caldisericia bacterium]|nr:C25 family cysteine peptidase [Caldisericia bacterium]